MQQRGGTTAFLRQTFGGEVFSTADALRAGLSARRLRLAKNIDGLRSLGGGRWVVLDADDSIEQYKRAAEALHDGRQDVVLAGVTAAAWWDLPCPDPGGDWQELPMCLASAKPIHNRRNLIRYRLGGRGVTQRHGLRVTDLPTTACDVARQLPTPQALIVVDAVARQLAGTSDRHLLRQEKRRAGIIDLLLAHAAASPRPNGARTRRTLSFAHPAADSPPESYIRGHILEVGKPAPWVNPPMTGASGKQYWVDLYWPDTAIAIEIDGAVKYTDGEVLYEEKKRHDDLRAAGVNPLRWTAETVFAFAPLLVGRLP